MALSLYCVFLAKFFFLNYSIAMLAWASPMPKSCIMFVWKIKFYSCVVRLLSYWLHSWNLIFQHKVYNVFRNPSWCHTFHFDVNFSLLSFVLRLHFTINVLTVIPLLCVAVCITSLLDLIPIILWRNHCHMHAHERELFSPEISWSVNNESVKWQGSPQVNFFLSPKRDRKA